MSMVCRRWSYPSLLSSAMVVILLGCKSQNSNDIDQNISQISFPDPLDNPVNVDDRGGQDGSLPTISSVIAMGNTDDEAALISAVTAVSHAPIVMEHSLPLLGDDHHISGHAINPRVLTRSIKVTVKNTQTVSIKRLALSNHHRYGSKAVGFFPKSKGSADSPRNVNVTNKLKLLV